MPKRTSNCRGDRSLLAKGVNHLNAYLKGRRTHSPLVCQESCGGPMFPVMETDCTGGMCGQYTLQAINPMVTILVFDYLLLHFWLNSNLCVISYHRMQEPKKWEKIRKQRAFFSNKVLCVIGLY